MSDTCYLCEYKRLARRAIQELKHQARLVGLIDLDAQSTLDCIAEGLRSEFLLIYLREQRDIEDAAMRKNGSRSPW